MTKWMLAGALVLAVTAACAEDKKPARKPKAAASGQMFSTNGSATTLAVP